MRDGLAERFVAGVIAQGDDEVRNAHLQRDRHATLQVQAQVQFLFNDLAVGVAQHRVDLRVGAVAQELTRGLCLRGIPFVFSDFSGAFEGIRYEGSIVGCFLLVIVRHPVETECVKCRERQQNGEEQNCILVLHDARVFFRAANIT